jgi:hypothetical protein
MIRFRHHRPNRLTVTKHYGLCFEFHPKRKSVDIFWGRHVFVFWVGRSYGEL